VGPALIVILVLVALVVIGVIVSYNRFVRQRNLIRDAWANIDTELRRRYDLIPNLVETAKGYIKHERETLEAVIAARTGAQSANQRAAAVRNQLETQGKVSRERLFLVEPKLTADGIKDKGATTRVDFSLK